MKYVLFFSLACLSWLHCPIAYAESDNNATADTVVFIPRFFLSYRDFEYTAGNASLSGDWLSVGLGLTASYRRFYLDLNAEINPTTNEEHDDDLFATAETVEYDRSDIALSLGYAVNESISTFVGYKYGKTVISIPDGELSLKGQGLFVGAGGRFAVRNWGYLSFSAAYANMQATYKDTSIDHDNGDASGTSLVLQWQAPLTQRMTYSVAIRRHDYDYENFDRREGSITEKIISVRLGIAYQF